MYRINEILKMINIVTLFSIVITKNFTNMFLKYAVLQNIFYKYSSIYIFVIYN